MNKIIKTKKSIMKNLANVLASTFTTILGTFTLSSIVYTWCYAIQLYL